MKRKLKAEMYDKVNFMCRCYMDRIARFRLDYDFVPDKDAFQKALTALYEASPVFHSRFVNNPINPYWLVSDYKIEDSFTFEETDDIENSAYDFLVRGIGINESTQMKIAVFHKDGKCALCFRWNHMLIDGGGFKQFARDLFRAYDEITEAGSCKGCFLTGSRAYNEVYRDFDEDKKKKAKAQILGNSAHEKKTLPFTAKSGKERNILIFKKIDADIFNSAAAKGKELGATANDVLVAAYIRSAYRIIGCDKKEKMSISCAVDLRRHMKNPDRIGYTNHTTFMPCTVKGMGDTMEDTVKAVAECNRENKKDPFLGLHGLPLLNFAYKAMTYIQAEPTVRLFYANANLALSNVGRVDKKLFSLGGNEPTDAFVAGGAKVKPCAAVNALSLDGRLTLSMTIQGTEEDRKMVEEFFEEMEKELKSLNN
ncbi:MAG: hypothetical protein IIX36_08220 [Clostridia bacterium]|nr:hypothetical protein [Clostridia bacterium]